MTKKEKELTQEKVSKENSIMKGEKLVANEPNARILISALQHIGYDDISAIADIIDNSIDANATEIKIFIDKDENNKIKITIVDNGQGMDRATLDEALKLGSNTIHEDIADLGKFGMGLSTAGLALANKTIVLTKNAESSKILKSKTDVNIIKEKNKFVKILEGANEEETVYFKNMVKNDSGTIIILEDCIGIKSSEASTLKEKVIKNVARVFRNFMSKTAFYVNDIKIEPDDPLRLKVKNDELKGTLFSEEDYTVKWKDKNNEEKNGSIHVKLSVLPECDANIARKMGFNMVNQGFSILRNNREIAYGYLPKWDGIARHPDLNRFRGEISFSSEMDDAMGVNFRKNGIDMVDSINNALRFAISPQIKTIRSRGRKKAKVSTEEREDHENAEKMLNKMSKILTLPKAKKEVRNGGKHIKEDENNEQQESQDKNDRIPNKTQNISAIAQFELIHMGETGDIYRAEQIGKKIVISWNVDHPFYQKFIAENLDNKNVIKIADFLIYTLASAQIQFMADDDEKSTIMSNIISTMSTNMRNLLS